MSVHLKLIIATSIWGLTPTVGKLLAPYEAPFIITFGRFLFASLWLFILLASRKEFQRIVNRRFFILFIVLGLTGVFLHNVLMYKGLEYTTASVTSLIFAFIIVQVAVIDSFIYKRFPSLVSMSGMFLSILGIVVVVTRGDISSIEVDAFGLGELLVFGSALSWAVYTVVSRKALEKYSPIVVTSYASGFGLLLVLPFPLINMEGAMLILGDLKALLFIVFLGVFSSAITFIWHQQAIAKIGVLSTSMYLNLMPVFGVISAAVVLGEPIDLYVVIGGALVLGGIILVNSKPVEINLSS